MESLFWDWALCVTQFEQDVGFLNQHVQQEAHQQRDYQVTKE